MPTATTKQLQARKRLKAATKRASAEYQKLPENMKNAKRWRDTVKKHL